MSELHKIASLLSDLDAIAGTAPAKHKRGLWDCTVAAWAAGAIRELLAAQRPAPLPSICPLCLDEGVLWSSDEQRCWPCRCVAQVDRCAQKRRIKPPCPMK
jgi:hypothetical protein